MVTLLLLLVVNPATQTRLPENGPVANSAPRRFRIRNHIGLYSAHRPTPEAWNAAIASAITQSWTMPWSLSS